jgi:hypothetical protein
VAAEYLTTISNRGGSQSTVWRFWRTENRVVTEDLDTHTGEQWQRDGSTLFHHRYFHDDRQGIEFQADDLRMFDALPVWAQQALLIDPAILQELVDVRSGWDDGSPYRRYAGTIAGAEWQITLLIDSMLPAAIERRANGVRQRTELVERYALADAPWTPTPTEGYRVLDFADLGDYERDPFVTRLLRQWGLEHAH